MRTHASMRRLATVLVALQLALFAPLPLAQAAMLGTPQVLQEQRQPVDRQQLLNMLEDQQVQQKLQELGIERQQVAARINRLTAAELAQFNQQLAQEPAGGIIGVIILLLVIFIITDMLCATDIFSFVKCVR